MVQIDRKYFDKNELFRGEYTARHRYNFIYNKYVAKLEAYDVEGAKAIKTLLTEIKTLSDNQGSKIDFSLELLPKRKDGQK